MYPHFPLPTPLLHHAPISTQSLNSRNSQKHIHPLPTYPLPQQTPITRLLLLLQVSLRGGAGYAGSEKYTAEDPLLMRGEGEEGGEEGVGARDEVGDAVGGGSEGGWVLGFGEGVWGGIVWSVGVGVEWGLTRGEGLLIFVVEWGGEGFVISVFGGRGGAA